MIRQEISINSNMDQNKRKPINDILVSVSKDTYNKFLKQHEYLALCIERRTAKKAGISRVALADIKRILVNLDKFIKQLSNDNYINSLVGDYSDSDSILFCEQIIRKNVNLKYYDEYGVVEALFSTPDFESYHMYEITVKDALEMRYKIENINNIPELLSLKKQIEHLIETQPYNTREFFESTLSILIDKIINLSIENSKKNYPESNPDPITPNNSPTSAEVGNSESSIFSLIDSNNYFNVLHAINTPQIEKYKYFIILGFNTILKRWRKKSELAKTYAEMEKSYFELIDIHNNFKDYLPGEEINELVMNLNSMKKYLDDNRPEQESVIGNWCDDNWNQLKNQNSSTMKM